MSGLAFCRTFADAHSDSRVYNNLTEEYSALDCATQAAKRHGVGERLRDVIEVLERKVSFNLLDVFRLLNVL